MIVNFVSGVRNDLFLLLSVILFFVVRLLLEMITERRCKTIGPESLYLAIQIT